MFWSPSLKDEFIMAPRNIRKGKAATLNIIQLEMNQALNRLRMFNVAWNPGAEDLDGHNRMVNVSLWLCLHHCHGNSLIEFFFCLHYCLGYSWTGYHFADKVREVKAIGLYRRKQLTSRSFAVDVLSVLSKLGHGHTLYCSVGSGWPKNQHLHGWSHRDRPWLRSIGYLKELIHKYKKRI